MSNELTDAIVGMREDEALAMVARELDAGVAPTVVLDQAKEAMTDLGRRFECGDAFIPELIMGGEIMKGISELGEAAPARRLGRDARGAASW